jgi:glutathione S-transferase
MSIVFYQAPYSSASPVAWALAELSVPHRTVTFDLHKDDHKKPEFLALNPNGRVPTLVVDGTPMFEALAIMQWLSDRHGVERRVWPAASSPARLTALSWTTWAYVTFGPIVTRLLLANGSRFGKELNHLGQAAFAQKELDSLLTILAGQLGEKAYLLGEAFSMVDLVVSSTVGYATFCGVSLGAHPTLAAWFARSQERPSLSASQQSP